MFSAAAATPQQFLVLLGPHVSAYWVQTIWPAIPRWQSALTQQRVTGQESNQKATRYDVLREVIRDGIVLGSESLIGYITCTVVVFSIYYRSALSNFIQNSWVNARAADEI